MAMCHLTLGQDEEIGGNLLLSAPFATVVVFFFLMGLHLVHIIKICRCKNRIVPVQEFKTPTTFWGKVKLVYHRYLGRDGLFGRRGKYYNWRLVIREVVEIPAQTYQGFLMSHRVPFTIFPTIYGCTIALDCILVPIVLLSPHLSLMARRNGVIMLDIVVDIVLGAILPFSVLVPAILMYLEDPRVKYDETFSAMAISSGRQIMVTSPLDLFISALPLYFSHMMMNSVHSNWLDTKSQKPVDTATVKPIKKGPKSKHAFRIFGSIWSAVWGIFILSETIRAPYMTSCGYNDVCALQVHPWFVYESRCECLVVDFNCALNPKVNENTFDLIAEASSQDIGQSSLYLIVQNCQLESIPPEVATMPNLFVLRVRNTLFESFDLDFSSCHSLMYLTMIQTGLPGIPETLKHPAVNLRHIYITDIPIKELPDWISTAWTNVRLVSFENFEFESFPKQLLSISDLSMLRLIKIPGITNLPSEIGTLQNLKSIEMDGCSLKQLPVEITTLPQLKVASFGGNQLESVPWSNQIVRDWQLKRGNVMFLQGNPVCDDLGQDIAPCSSGCSDTCPPTVYCNRVCNVGCNSASCDWDGGDCQH